MIDRRHEHEYILFYYMHGANIFAWVYRRCVAAVTGELRRPKVRDKWYPPPRYIISVRDNHQTFTGDTQKTTMTINKRTRYGIFVL